MRNYRSRRSHRAGRNDGSFWLSFSDLMSCLLLIIILIMFYIMYQSFEMYEIHMAEIARQQYDLEAANATLEAERTKLSEAEQQMLAQQIRLNAAEDELMDAEAVLAQQQQDLNAAQALLGEKEAEITAQQDRLLALSAQLDQQQLALDAQQSEIETQRTAIADQQTQIANQQTMLDDQQAQLEELVGLKTRIITQLSSEFKAANISAMVDPVSGAIVLESDVLFSSGQYDLTTEGKRSIDAFLPIYLDVLFSEEYKEYVSEIIIEGHTDSVGGYLENLVLSQQRAARVATYVLNDDYHAISRRQLVQLREVVTANGKSFSDPILDENGREDKDASRRVVFKFRLTDEQMIDQMKTILEANE